MKIPSNTMPTPQETAAHLQSVKDAIIGMERAKHATFVEDFEKSSQCVRSVEEHFMFIKHSVVPGAIEASRKEGSFAMNDTFYSPWIVQSSTHRKIADECVMRALRKMLPEEYEIAPISAELSNRTFRISWK